MPAQLLVLHHTQTHFVLLSDRRTDVQFHQLKLNLYCLGDAATHHVFTSFVESLFTCVASADWLLA